jgi:hypothetical protein
MVDQRPRPGRGFALRGATGVLLVGGIWLAFELFVLGPFSYMHMSDMADHHVPMHLSAVMEVFPGSNWHRFLGAGTDRDSLGVMGPVDQILFRLLPGWLAVILLSAGQIAMAVIFTYKLCRDNLALPAHAAAFAALCFAATLTSGRLMNIVVALLPYLIWSLSYAMDNKKDVVGWLVLFVAAFIFAGVTMAHLVVPWPLMAVFAWFVIVEPKKNWMDWALFLALSVVIVAMRWQDFMAMVAYAPISNRAVAYNPMDVAIRLGAHDPFFVPFGPRLDAVLSSIKSVILQIGPWSPFVILALVLALRSQRQPGVARVALFAAVILFASIPILAIKYAVIDWLPSVRGVRSERLGIFWTFPFSVLAAFGIAALDSKRVFRNPFSKRGALVNSRLMVAGIGFFLIFVFNGFDKFESAKAWVRYGTYARNFQSPVIKEFAETHSGNNNPYRVASFQMSGAIANAYGLESVDGKFTIAPNRYREFWGKVIEKYLARDQYKRELFWGTSSGSVLNLFYNWPHSSVVVADNYNMALLSLAGMRYIFSRDELIDPDLVEIRKMDRPWNDFSTIEKAWIGIRENFTGRKHLYIYENVGAFPRAFIVGNVRLFPDRKSLLAALGLANVETLRQEVFVESDQAKLFDVDNLNNVGGTVKFLKYSSDHLKLFAKTSGKSLLVITNNFAKFWQCKRNGEAVMIFPAYSAFWGIPLIAGEQTITCDYRPAYRIF